jgi:hypothetical protein
VESHTIATKEKLSQAAAGLINEGVRATRMRDAASSAIINGTTTYEIFAWCALS